MSMMLFVRNFYFIFQKKKSLFCITLMLGQCVKKGLVVGFNGYCLDGCFFATYLIHLGSNKLFVSAVIL